MRKTFPYSGVMGPVQPRVARGDHGGLGLAQEGFGRGSDWGAYEEVVSADA